MKIKQVYISDENFEELKNINASALVNELLNIHFKTLIPKSKKALLDELKIRKIELDAIKKIGAIQNGSS